MLKKILSITGKPGLYRLLSQGRGTLIVESLDDNHRFPVHARDKVVSLGDISMYTENGDTMLGEIMDKVYAAQGGKPVDYKNMDGKTLHATFGKMVEDYDRERVRDNDIKKLFQWYDMLIAAGFTEFSDKQEEADERGTTPESEPEKK